MQSVLCEQNGYVEQKITLCETNPVSCEQGHRDKHRSKKVKVQPSKKFIFKSSFFSHFNRIQTCHWSENDPDINAMITYKGKPNRSSSY